MYKREENNVKRRYRRYFIMFELEDKNFGAFENEEAKGYAKIEIKNNQGLLSIYCQNLKSSNGDRKYMWYLINTKTDGAPIIVEIGPMEVDEKGKGEEIYEFDPENVGESAEQIDNFDVLASVARNAEGEGKLCTPLAGYMDKKRPGAGSWQYALGKYLYIPLDEEKMAGGEAAQYHKSAEEVMEESVGETTEDVIEGIIESPVKEATEEIIEETTEKVAEEIAEESAGKITEEVAEKIVEEIMEEIEKGTGEGAARKVTGEIKKEISEETLKESKEEIIEEIAEELKKEPIDEAIEKVVDKITEKISKEATEKVAEEISGKVMKDAEKIVRETEEEHGGEESAESKIEEGSGGSAEIEDDYEGQMQAYIENSLKDFLQVEPFVESPEDYTWWQIPYDTQTMYRAYMPFISYLDSLREPIDHNISKVAQIVYIHQHHIFGICYDENNKAKNYAYGVLGRNFPLEQPFEINEGLAYWHPCDNVPVNIESYGYWILTIDPKTGDAM